MDELLNQAVSAIKMGDIIHGKQLLVKLLEQDSRNELAWLWMSRCVDNYDQKLDCLNRVLEINPNNTSAQKEISRLQTLEKIKASPISPPLQSPVSPQLQVREQKKPTKPSKIVIAVILLVAFICVCVLGPLASNSTTQSNTPTTEVISTALSNTPVIEPTNTSLSNNVTNSAPISSVKKISGDNWFGCSDRDDFEKIIGYAVDKDTQAFQEALATGIYNGTCTLFKNGDVVYVTDTAIFSGILKVRLKGETQEFWTNFEAVK